MCGTWPNKALAVNARFVHAASFFNARMYDKAIVHLSEFVKANPKDDMAPQAQYLIGLSYHQKKVFGIFYHQ